MPEVSAFQWDEFLSRHPETHLLQTSAWGDLKAAFGWDVARLVAEESGAQVLFRRLPLGFTLAYIPKGPVGKPSKGFWDELDRLCHTRRAIFVKIEPDEWETGASNLPQSGSRYPGFQHSLHNIQPPRTLVVDLEGDEDQILAHMKQKTRYNIRLAEKKGVSVRAWDDIPAFHQMMLITGGRDQFGVHSEDYYHRVYELFQPSGSCELLVAEYENKPLAALMVFARGARAWYLYGASTDEERNRMPTYLLQWIAMRWARSKGCREYDLWGVPDEDEGRLEAQFTERRDGLWGVYRFKRGFGGELKRAAQAQDKIYNHLLYKLYLQRMAGRELA